MYSSGELPWKKIHEFLLDVGNIRHPHKTICVEVVRKIKPLVPFDQARVYFVNDSGKIYDQVLVRVDQRLERCLSRVLLPDRRRSLFDSRPPGEPAILVPRACRRHRLQLDSVARAISPSPSISDPAAPLQRRIRVPRRRRPDQERLRAGSDRTTSMRQKK